MPIKILLADLSIVYVQKKKLVEKSIVFDVMLSQNMLEAKNKLIDMSAYNPIAVINLLYYVLYDKYPAFYEFANKYEYKAYLETYALAHQYSIVPLANHVANSIANGINNIGTFNMIFDYKNTECPKFLLFQIRDLFIKRIYDMVIFNPLHQNEKNEQQITDDIPILDYESLYPNFARYFIDRSIRFAIVPVSRQITYNGAVDMQIYSYDDDIKSIFDIHFISPVHQQITHSGDVDLYDPN